MQPSAGAEVINLQDGGHRVTDAGVEDTEESVQVPGILEPHRTLSRALTDTRGGHPNSKAPETGSRYAEHRPAVDSHLGAVNADANYEHRRFGRQLCNICKANSEAVLFTLVSRSLVGASNFWDRDAPASCLATTKAASILCQLFFLALLRCPLPAAHRFPPFPNRPSTHLRPHPRSSYPVLIHSPHPFRHTPTPAAGKGCETQIAQSSEHQECRECTSGGVLHCLTKSVVVRESAFLFAACCI